MINSTLEILSRQRPCSAQARRWPPIPETLFTYDLRLRPRWRLSSRVANKIVVGRLVCRVTCRNRKNTILFPVGIDWFLDSVTCSYD